MSKKKKEKITYIDDGRTIADMSAFTGRKKHDTDKNNFVRPQSTFKDKWKTYWTAVARMIIPMFITLGIITLMFFFSYVFLGGFNNQ